MNDAPAFHDYAQKDLAARLGKSAEILVAGNFPDFAAYKHAAGVHRGLTEAAEILASTYKRVIEGVKPQKEPDAGRKSEARRR